MNQFFTSINRCNFNHIGTGHIYDQYIMTSSLISFKIFNNDFKCIIIQIHEPANTGILVYISCHIEIEYINHVGLAQSVACPPLAR